MNFKIFFPVLLGLILFYWGGYKMGDSRGYEAGYEEGYSYDCQEEIKGLRATHEDLKKAVKAQEQLTLSTQRRLDSVAYHEEGYHDAHIFHDKQQNLNAFECLRSIALVPLRPSLNPHA